MKRTECDKSIRVQADPRTAEGCGLFSQPAEWKGMGPSGSSKPPSIAISSCFGYFLFFVWAFLISISVEAMQTALRDGCGTESCSIIYVDHKTGIDDHEVLCRLVRTFNNCLLQNANNCDGYLMYKALRKYADSEGDKYNCNKSDTRVEPISKGPDPVPALCDYPSHDPSFKLCVLFGDPHLKTFNEEFQTCKVKGTWPLLDNDYLTIQVTNNEVEGTLEATAISKLTVIVKGNPECTSKDFQTYLAFTNSLPGTFEDGRVVVGKYNSLELIEVDPGRHVEIHIRYIKTTVVIRQIGRYFTFSINMPEKLISQGIKSDGLDLCVRGCPQSELINYKEVLAKQKFCNILATEPAQADGTLVQPVSRPQIPRSKAEEICKSAKLVGFFFESCVFDLVTTGDQNFASAAVSAVQDAVHLQPSLANNMSNRTSLDTYDRMYGTYDCNNSSCIQSNTLPHHYFFIVLLCVLTRLLCTR
ncbi:repulsive guidance molecule A-like isoform X2 [Biomphalaria glabrata]|uniref:Repulsive guidance molecule A-like isoform X2 n=1 Tax=Biomphalaria glabrata TaxID=6526 RepID=A0A9W3BEH5_BIOGL|nr:repulsive guidance molecule A-like isoform X2 [Biomphalaria glabrata]